VDRDRITERANKRKARYEYKLSKEYNGIVKMFEMKANEATPSPWCKPDSTGNWNGMFDDTLKAVNYQ